MATLDKCNIIVKNGGTLIIDGAFLVIDGTILILSGGYICQKGMYAIILRDENSIIHLIEGSILGTNPELFTNEGCLSAIPFTGNGDVVFMPPPDLYLRDNTFDYAVEPNATTTEHYLSPDIKIVDMAGNAAGKLDPNSDYKVKVTVRNRTNSITSTGGEQLKLYWAKAGINENWPSQWNGTPAYYGNGGRSIVLGGLLGEAPIPAGILPNGYTDVYIDWKAVDRPTFEEYLDYVNHTNAINGGDEYEENIWHYCLLAVLEDGHPVPNIDAENDVPLRDFVLGSNNVASVNVEFMHIKQNSSLISIMQPNFNPENSFDIKVSLKNAAYGESLLQYAEIYVKPDPELQSVWQNTGSQGSGLKQTDKGWLITENEAVLRNIILPAKQLHSLFTQIYFLSKEIPENEAFEFDISMNINGVNQGGEHYVVSRDLTRYFAVQANAEAQLLNDKLLLKTDGIGEPAQYIWYDQTGDKIGSDREILTELPKTSQWYKLEVIADSDHYKDYDSVYVNIPMGHIVNLSPNPTNNQVLAEYFLSDIVNTAALQFYNSLGNLVKQESLNISENEKMVSLSGLLNGTYSVVLLINGTAADSKPLIKQ
jgi:hypothetical protein